MTIPENRDPSASKLNAALDAKPTVQIPPDFAAKVAALAVMQPTRQRRRVPQMGRNMALVLAPLAAIAMFALAPHASPNPKSIIFDTEVILIAQLALIGWWVSGATGFRIARWR